MYVLFYKEKTILYSLQLCSHYGTKVCGLLFPRNKAKNEMKLKDVGGGRRALTSSEWVSTAEKSAVSKLVWSLDCQRQEEGSL